MKYELQGNAFNKCLLHIEFWLRIAEYIPKTLTINDESIEWIKKTRNEDSEIINIPIKKIKKVHFLKPIHVALISYIDKLGEERKLYIPLMNLRNSNVEEIKSELISKNIVLENKSVEIMSA